MESGKRWDDEQIPKTSWDVRKFVWQPEAEMFDIQIQRLLSVLDSPEVNFAIMTPEVHPLVPELPFGGVGNSGMGKYHGNGASTRSPTHAASSTTAPRIDPGVRYPPYSEHQRERTVESWVT